MKRTFWFLAVAIGAAALLAVDQSKQINTARTELVRLEANAVGHLSKAPGPLSTSAATEEEMRRLRADNRDIHKLRGQISQAREKRKEIERMQAENAQIRRQIEQLKTNPQAGSAQSFPLLNKGGATPEAALETTFWSMYHGNVETLSRLMPMVTMEFEKMPPAEKTNSLMMLKGMAATIEKMEIVEQKFESPDEAHLTVRMTWAEGMGVSSAFGPGKSTFILRRTNDSWQIVSERRSE